MHFEQNYYVSIIKRHFPASFSDAEVLEIGSYDVNGSIRAFFKNCEYTGLDLMSGPGVDVVASGHDYDTYKRFDAVLSCECFEHNPHYFKTFENMVSKTCGGGLVVVTCASEGRPEHGTTRTNPELSPGTSSIGWDYYKNIAERDFAGFDFKRNFAGHRFFINPGSQDLYFVGVKYPAPEDLEDQLNGIVEEVGQLTKVSVQFVSSDVLFLAGDPSSAADGLDSIASLLHPDLEAYVRYKQAWYLISAKRYREAETVSHRLLLLGDRPEYHFQYSQLLHETGRPEAAKEAAHAAIKREPSNAEYWEHLANLLLNSGDTKGAEGALLEASRLSPQDASRKDRIKALGFQQRPAENAARSNVLLTYAISFFALSAPGSDQKIRLWNLESPVADIQEATSDEALLFTGWILTKNDQDVVSVLIKVGTSVELYALNVERPDVITAILQEPPEGHAQLKCGFHFPVPVKVAFFSLGFRMGAADIWEREVRVIYQPPHLTGKNSWEFPADDVNGVMELHGKPPLYKEKDVLAWQKRFAGNSAGIKVPYLVLVAPHKAAVYPNFLPADTSLFFQRPVYQVMGQDPSVVYPLERIVSSSMRRPTYPHSGALWAPYGAYVAYRALMDKLSYVRPSVPVVEENRIVWGTEGALPVFERKAALVCENGLDGTGKIKYFKNSDSALPRTLLFCEAFGMTYFDSFLAESCSELVCVFSPALDRDAIARFAPDFVVSQYPEEILASSPTKETLSIYQVIKTGINSGTYSAVMLEQFVSMGKDCGGILSDKELADLALEAQAGLVL